MAILFPRPSDTMYRPRPHKLSSRYRSPRVHFLVSCHKPTPVTYLLQSPYPTDTGGRRCKTAGRYRVSSGHDTKGENLLRCFGTENISVINVRGASDHRINEGQGLIVLAGLAPSVRPERSTLSEMMRDRPSLEARVATSRSSESATRLSSSKVTSIPLVCGIIVLLTVSP